MVSCKCHIGGDNMVLDQQILNKMTINLDMFGMLMENKIISNKPNKLIVTEYLYSGRNIKKIISNA